MAETETSCSALDFSAGENGRPALRDSESLGVSQRAEVSTKQLRSTRSERAGNLDTALRVATLNVRGLAARRRQYQLSRLFLDNDLDVVAVQETKVESEEQTSRMLQPFSARYNVCVCHSVGRSGGCALFLRSSVGIVIVCCCLYECAFECMRFFFFQ